MCRGNVINSGNFTVIINKFFDLTISSQSS